MKQFDDLSPKEQLRGTLAVLVIVLFFVFSFWHIGNETKYVEEHGVWTILTVTHSKNTGKGYNVYYTFQLNSQTFSDHTNMSDKKLNSGNRFFVLVVPGEEGRHSIYNVVPDWFTLNAPSEGWKRKPSKEQLEGMMLRMEEDENSGNEKANPIDHTKIEEVIELNEWGKLSDKNSKIIQITLSILCFVAFIVLVLYRKNRDRYIKEHGFWTILTITQWYGVDVEYTFQLNNETYTGSCSLSKKHFKTGANRFFLVVMPGETMKKQIENAVPDWFTGEAPPQGWDKLPNETELREYMNKR